MPMVVPGIGYAGLGQQTAAGALVFRKAMGKSAGPTRRPASRRAVRSRIRKRNRQIARTGGRYLKPSSSRSRGKLKRLVRGSAAAKRHMAKLRRMRKRA